MDLNYLRVFYQVARDGKFSESAKNLNISQSALSRSVNLLEETEGVVLFDRSKSGVKLTQKGEEVFRLCEQLFHVEKEIENLCRGVSEKVDGFLKFAASDHIINDFIPKPLYEFKKLHPTVVPTIRSGTPDELMQFLLKSESEFALMFAKINTPQLEFIRLHSETMSLVCHPDLWKECKSQSNEKTLRKLITKYGYMSAIGASMTSRSSQVLLELFGDIPPIAIEVNSQESQKKFCLEKIGVAYLSNFMVKDEIEKGELFEIPVDHGHEFNLWLARPRGKHMSLTARSFLKHLFPDLDFK